MVLIKELGVRTVGSSSKSIALYACPMLEAEHALAAVLTFKKETNDKSES